jgi:glycerol 2-dehydrogenase (NADP+)
LLIIGPSANGEHDNVATAFDASLKALGVEYVDLYLMHWPQADVDGWSGKTRRPDEAPTIVDTWLAMEKLLDSGMLTSFVCPPASDT